MWTARFAAGCRSDNARGRQCTNCKSPGGDSGVTSGQAPERYRRVIERTIASRRLGMAVTPKSALLTPAGRFANPNREGVTA